MIDKATVAQILDTANIVEVVSDFVSLKRRGSATSVCALSTTRKRHHSACRRQETIAIASAVARVEVRWAS